MYPTHRYYGHQSILATYTGRVDGGPPIVAQLQHGWQPGAAFHHGTRLPDALPKLVWSTRNARELRALGHRRVTAIGAPFVHLDAILGAPASPGSGTLVYPFHQVHSASMHGDPADLCRAVAEREADADRVTVCLYFRDHDDPAMRRVYEEAGFRVITHGHRDDPAFLLRQWAELADHAKVVTNRVSSALWYGGLLDRRMEVYGPMFGSRGDHERSWFDDLQRSSWPDLFSGGIGPGDARDASAEQLGVENLRAPEELEELLGWRGARRLTGPVLATGLSINRTLAGLRGSRPRPAPDPTPPEERSYR